VQPSPPDIWAAEGTLRLAAEEKRPALLVLNRVPAGARVRETADRALRDLGLVPLAATLGNRAAYSHAFAAGLGVTEAEPRSAAAELRALADAIWATLA
jgi:chromosome partitioning protein